MLFLLHQFFLFYDHHKLYVYPIDYKHYHKIDPIDQAQSMHLLEYLLKFDEPIFQVHSHYQIEMSKFYLVLQYPLNNHLLLYQRSMVNRHVMLLLNQSMLLAISI